VHFFVKAARGKTRWLPTLIQATETTH